MSTRRKKIKKTKSQKPSFAFGGAGLEEDNGLTSSIISAGQGVLGSMGPIGMLAGAALPYAIQGLKKLAGPTKREKFEQQAMKNSATRDAILSSQDRLKQGFTHGGSLLAHKLGEAYGGHLEPISEDAVEVKAYQPNLTDSVELPTAFVDHNEVIDDQKRVFSDSIPIRSGKRSIAKEAKRLEKMKTSNTRYNRLNDHIEGKLDKLFEYQEAKKLQEQRNSIKSNDAKPAFKKGGNMKGKKHNKPHKADMGEYGFLDNLDNDKDSLSKGGKIYIKPSKRGSLHKHLGVPEGRKIPASKLKIHPGDSPAIRKKKQFAINAKKWHHEFGGFLDNLLENRLSDIDEARIPGYAFGGEIGGGGDPIEAPQRQLSKDQVVAYREHVRDPSITPLVDIEENDPIFSDKGAFQDYYRKKAIASLQGDDRAMYEEYAKKNDRAGIDSFIALRGGTPDFETYKKVMNADSMVKNSIRPSTIGKVKSGLPKVGGYRYGAKGGKGLPARGSITKPGYAGGGNLFSEEDLAPSEKGTPIDLDQGSGSFMDTPFGDGQSSGTSTEGEGGGFNWREAGTTAASFLPNIANSILQSNLAGPPAPINESMTSLDRINANDQLAANTRDFRSAQTMLSRNTAQGSNLTSSVGNLLAKRFASQNAIIGDVNRTNAEIQAQEAMINSGVRARNANRMNQFRADQVGFKNLKRQMTSQNIASVSDKIQQMGRERNMKARDLLAMKLLSRGYGDSGVFDRNLGPLIDRYLKG